MGALTLSHMLKLYKLFHSDFFEKPNALKEIEAQEAHNLNNAGYC